MTSFRYFQKQLFPVHKVAWQVPSVKPSNWKCLNVWPSSNPILLFKSSLILMGKQDPDTEEHKTTAEEGTLLPSEYPILTPDMTKCVSVNYL